MPWRKQSVNLLFLLIYILILSGCGDHTVETEGALTICPKDIDNVNFTVYIYRDGSKGNVLLSQPVFGCTSYNVPNDKYLLYAQHVAHNPNIGIYNWETSITIQSNEFQWDLRLKDAQLTAPLTQ